MNLAATTVSATSTPLPTSLGGTTVTISGTATGGTPFTGVIPLFYVSPLQINAQIPPNLVGSVTITVVSGTTTGVSTTVTLNSVSPGIFVASGTQGAILNQDFSPNSSTNPAASGSVILIYATGLGPTNPPLAAGQAGAHRSALECHGKPGDGFDQRKQRRSVFLRRRARLCRVVPDQRADPGGHAGGEFGVGATLRATSRW